jgi:hypothetical protein
MGILANPQSSLARALPIWYALFQTAQAVLNARYLLNPVTLPFAPPPGGWVPQTVAFLNSAAVLDFVNALLAVVFVVGFLRRRHRSAWLGTLTLTVSIYAGATFIWGIVQAGAWEGIGREYLWVNVPFVPVVALFAAWSYWAATGRLASVVRASWSRDFSLSPARPSGPLPPRAPRPRPLRATPSAC